MHSDAAVLSTGCQEGSESAHLQRFPPDQGSGTQETAWATYMYGGSGRGWNGLKHVEGSHVPRRVWRVPASVPAVFRLMGSQ